MALTVAQLSHDMSPEITGYGALGIICAWLIYRDERRSSKQDKQMEALKEEMRRIGHRMSGLSRALTMNAATHGTDELRTVALKELSRMQEADEARNGD